MDFSEKEYNELLKKISKERVKGENMDYNNGDLNKTGKDVVQQGGFVHSNAQNRDVLSNRQMTPHIKSNILVTDPPFNHESNHQLNKTTPQNNYVKPNPNINTPNPQQQPNHQQGVEGYNPQYPQNPQNPQNPQQPNQVPPQYRQGPPPQYQQQNPVHHQQQPQQMPPQYVQRQPQQMPPQHVQQQQQGQQQPPHPEERRTPPNPLQDETFYSEEVHEILSQVPNWMIRWGTTLMFVIIAGILIMSYFIKYPDVVPGRITLSAGNPPVSVVAKASGAIKLLANDNDVVKSNQVFAYIDGTTKFDDVITLNRRLKQLNNTLRNGGEASPNNWPNLNLGQIQYAYNNLILKIKEKETVNQTGVDNLARKQNINQQINELNRQKAAQKSSIQRLKRDYDEQRNTFETRYRPLFKSGIISAEELESRKREVLQKENIYENAKTVLNEYASRILNLESQKSELDYNKGYQNINNQNAISDAHATLSNQIKLWEDQYLLRAPIGGKINFLQFVKDNSYIGQEQPLASIIPDGGDGDEISGELFVPAKGTGEIEVGQDVTIGLDDYPQREYGSVRGKVKSISDVSTPLPDGQLAYKVYVELPLGIQTKSNTDLAFRHNMGGSAEIITEDVRLLSRIFNELKGIFEDIE